MEFSIAAAGPRAARVAFRGRLDAAGAERIEEALAAALARDQRHLLFDLTEVPFVGSLGIRLITASFRAAGRRGLRLVVFGAQPAVQEVFDTVALDAILPVAADEAAAMAALGA